MCPIAEASHWLRACTRIRTWPAIASASPSRNASDVSTACLRMFCVLKVHFIYFREGFQKIIFLEFAMEGDGGGICQIYLF